MIADLFKSFPGFPILLSSLFLFSGTAFVLPQSRNVHRLLRLIGMAVLATAVLAIGLAFANLMIPDYVDNVEPPVVANAWIWWHGGQLYPDVGPGTELRGLLYGPLTFFLTGLMPVLFGPSIFVTKLLPVCLFLGSVVLSWMACRRAGVSTGEAILATAAMTVVLGISDAPYWVRGDTALIFIGACAAWLVARPTSHALRRAIALGALAGAASAFKLHGAAYVAPACLMALLDAASWRAAIWSFILLAAASALVFALSLLPSGVSTANYLFHLRLAAHHGFSLKLFLGNLTLLIGISLPILVLSRTGTALPRRTLYVSAAAFCCAAVVALIAAKPGAGYPHLLPFLPYAALLTATVLSTHRKTYASGRLLAIGIIFCLAFCVPVLVRAATFLSRGPEFATINAAGKQVRDVLRQHRGEVVAVGYGGGSFLDLRLSYLRALPVFAGNPLFYDATAMDDLWQGGMDRSIALTQLDRCGVKVWLIPGDEPFTIRNFYGGFTFSEEFRKMFFEKYRQEPSGGPFSVWICRD